MTSPGSIQALPVQSATPEARSQSSVTACSPDSFPDLPYNDNRSSALASVLNWAGLRAKGDMPETVLSMRLWDRRVLNDVAYNHPARLEYQLAQSTSAAKSGGRGQWHVACCNPSVEALTRSLHEATQSKITVKEICLWSKMIMLPEVMPIWT